jgi:hypothetical protein
MGVSLSPAFHACYGTKGLPSCQQLTSQTICKCADFNLYTNAGGGNGLLGWTYFPFQNPGVLDSSVIYW